MCSKAMNLSISTKDGILLKTLVDIIYGPFNRLALNVSDKGIFTRMTNTRNTILFDFLLEKEKFDTFYIKESLVFGVNIVHLNKILSPIKKEDTLKLEIFEHTPDRLEVSIIPKKQTHRKHGFVTIDKIQIIEVDLPEGYNQPIRGCISTFSKMWKELNNISKTIQIHGGENHIVFNSVLEGVLGLGTEFPRGERAICDPDNDFDELFNVADLLKLGKLSNIGSSIYIYSTKNLPFKITTNVGLLGNLSIYITRKVVDEIEV